MTEQEFDNLIYKIFNFIGNNFNFEYFNSYMDNEFQKDLNLMMIGCFIVFAVWFFGILFCMVYGLKCSIMGVDMREDMELKLNEAKEKIIKYKPKELKQLKDSGVSICPQCGAPFQQNEVECSYCSYVSQERMNIKNENEKIENLNKKEKQKLEIEYQKAKNTYGIKIAIINNILKSIIYVVIFLFCIVPLIMFLKIILIFVGGFVF